jgi:hypothetical protein
MGCPNSQSNRRPRSTLNLLTTLRPRFQPLGLPGRRVGAYALSELQALGPGSRRSAQQKQPPRGRRLNGEVVNIERTVNL